MASQTCHYDCTENRTNTKLPPYPDVSGLGVSLAYTISATLAVLFVLFYYVFAHRPDVPSRFHRYTLKARFSFRSNPVDMSLLFWRLHAPHNQTVLTRRHIMRKNHAESALIEFILVISDFQLLAGISILISGFTQLRCGITAYHWQKIVRLAYLSSITHLCCLTFLRDYFYMQKFSRFWRIPGMIVLVIVLIIAMIPTGRYTWHASETYRPWPSPALPNPQSYAVCYFYGAVNTSVPLFHTDDPELKQYEDVIAEFVAWSLEGSQQQTTFVIALLSVGMLQRLWNLHRWSINTHYYIREYVRNITHSLLLRVHKHTREDQRLPHLWNMFLYRPLLALYLSMQYFIDIIQSIAWEIYGLVLFYVWGVLNLWPRKKEQDLSPTEPGRFEWSYGQVMALLILVPPVLTLLESFLKNSPRSTDEDITPARTNEPWPPLSGVSELGLPTTFDSNSLETLGQHPERNFYQYYWSFSPVLYAGLVNIVVISFSTLTALAEGSWQPSRLFDLKAKHHPFRTLFPVMLVQQISCTLVSLAFEGQVSQWDPRCLSQQFTLFLYYLGQFQVPYWYEMLYKSSGWSFREYRQGYQDAWRVQDKYGTLASPNFLWAIILNIVIYFSVSGYDVWKQFRKTE